MLKRFNRLLALAAALVAGVGVHADQPASQEAQRRTAAPTVGGDQNAIVERAIRRRSLAMARLAAADRAKPAREAAQAALAAKKNGKASAMTVGGKGQAAAWVQGSGVHAPYGVLDPLGVPDYMGGLVSNYANSPLPSLVKDPVTGAYSLDPTNTQGIHKFVDSLPGVGAGHANNLGNYIPLATKDTTTFPGSDYYDISVVDYQQKLHTDLGPTHLRGYKDNKGGDGKAHYLGPIIIAQKNVPVRVKFTNALTDHLRLPVDATLMGAGAGPGGNFSNNRAELHLHGGMSPWISDGTPHQWLTPATDPSSMKKGVSFRNVPDMVDGSLPASSLPITSVGITDATDGVGSYFWTNQQSGRFMFYHDHSFGLTRLNVYYGEAAGYLIVDPTDERLIDTGVVPNQGGIPEYRYGIPLVFQDKTFVPNQDQLAITDPTHDTTNWGASSVAGQLPSGDLWYPHVYMTNQNPADLSGANAMGRWDYGPWFWPPVPVATDPTAPTPANTIPYANRPLPQAVTDALGNPVLGANGQPLVVDRPGAPNPSLTPEAFMDTAVVNGTPYPYMEVEPKAYRFRLLNAANDRMFAFSFYVADPAAPTEVKMIEANPTNSDAATAYFAARYPGDTNLPNWPRDGRDGGVVDFATAGPDILQIGNEGGMLPNPVLWKAQATNYNYNRRDIVVLDVAEHGLFLGPAERADIIVNFKGYEGQTLILYNDMLAPVPAFDVRYDYFTGAPDQGFQGGAPPSMPGFGPNTRTLMQFRVLGAATTSETATGAYDVTKVTAAFTSTVDKPSAFAEAQHLPIIPQAAYDNALGKTGTLDTFSTIQATELKYTATENGQAVTMPLQPKAIQELFELDYGRMNATLGIELPFTNFNNQTTIPLGYSEPATEVLTDGETQAWKVTHNGVDTHPVHFHLYDVQLVNRVGWDGAVRFPEDNEIGWKETVKMKPLEDAIVIFRPISPRLPFVLGNSLRVIDPTKAVNADILVTDLGAGSPNQGNLGNQITIKNAVTDYGWEYVWHCHILGHEENDFMRPVVLNVATTGPSAIDGNGKLFAARADALTATVNVAATNRVDLAWHDNTINETGFSIQRRDHGTGAFTEIGSAVPNAISWSDYSINPGSAYDYQVVAYNQAGGALASNVATVGATVANPVNITGTITTASGPLAGAAVLFSTGEVAVTNVSGQYSVTLSGPYTGTETPSLAGYAFTAPSKAWAAITTDQVQNFSAVQQVTITGTVRFGLGVLSGVTMTASNGGGTTTTAADGTYSFTIAAPYTGTVTASRAGYIFTPATRTYAAATGTQGTQDFTANQAITFSGTVTRANGTVPFSAVAGLTITLSTGQTATTLANGTYTLTAPAPFTGTVSVAPKAGEIFTPATIALNAVVANRTGLNFTVGYAVPVIGVVTSNTAPYQPIAGVTLTFSNLGGTATTDANGLYTHNVSSGYSGTVTPSLAGYVFTPGSRNLTNVSSPTSLDFQGGQVFVISGTVTSNGVGVGNVVINLTNQGGSTTTAANGTYSVTVNAGWAGTISATRAGYQFTSITVPAVSGALTGQNFASYQTISGRTVRSNGNAVIGATITLSTGGSVTSVGPNGNFTINVPTGWSGTITVSGGGRTWLAPTSFTYNNLTTNPSGLRFTSN